MDYFDFFINNAAPKSSHIKPYSIWFYHLVIVLEGSLTYIADGETILLEENDALLLVPGTHRERLYNPNHSHFVILNYFSENDPKANILFKNAVNQTIRNLLNVYPYKSYQNLNTDASTTPDNPKVYNRLFHILQCILIELFETIENPTQNIHIVNALKYINDNITSPITLDDVSRTIHLSKEYTSRLFKQEMNMTVSQYINKRKLTMAKDIIANEIISLQNIAKNFGYANYNYFNKVFKEEYGISPQKMRNDLKKISKKTPV